jgi:hypothetical protein
MFMAAAVALLPPASGPVARADETSAALAKYSKPAEDAVTKALAYLAKNQGKEGSWPSNIGDGKDTAIASLCVMAFLAKGYTPGTGPYGDVINKGIDFVLDVGAQQRDGLLSKTGSQGPFGYEHCISTLMLSEVSGMVDPARQKRLDGALPKALAMILRAQQANKPDTRYRGGWRYQVTANDSDISCTGWALMALRSARNNGAKIPDQAIEGAVRFVLACRDQGAANDAQRQYDPKRGVGFCYQPGSGPGLARTGTAVLCLELCGKHNSKETTQGGDWILANPSTRYGEDFFYYGLYYTAQAMFQLGDKYWESFAPAMYDKMLKAQQKDGSWPQGGGNENGAGVCYATAMSVLAISVGFRQLPIYQR